ncbi:MAG: hypothetical protein DRI57_00055 [Deltaproteobacteria bacterium]|nr:MAG: hypothetical protein DRI57_00055 [Deltaproteobacteria bacterium]
MGKKESYEFREITLDHLFPRRVIIMFLCHILSFHYAGSDSPGRFVQASGVIANFIFPRVALR